MKQRPTRIGDAYQIGAARFEVTCFSSWPDGWRAIGVETVGGVSRASERPIAELARATLVNGGMGSACEGT